VQKEGFSSENGLVSAKLKLNKYFLDRSAAGSCLAFPSENAARRIPRIFARSESEKSAQPARISA
jgi:hypothetical protein